jgi:Zn-dependent M28 family amino/carboxypeptidase
MRAVLLSLALLACAHADDDTPPVETPVVTADDDPILGADRLLEHLEALEQIARDNDGNRAIGTQGYLDSLTWAEDVFTGLGLETRREPFDLAFFDLADASLTLGEDDLRVGRDFSVFEWSGEGDLSGTVTPVDVQLPPGSQPNSSTSACEPEDFDDFVAGTIALVQRGSCTFAEKVANAEAAGAVAVLIFNEGQSGRRDIVTGVLDQAAPATVPVAGLTFADGEWLATDPQLVELSVDTDVERIESWNLLADLPGASGRFWVIGAHLDSVPAGPGINDNGTGTSLVLQLAERLAGTTPEHGVRFALWGGEEVGLVGSLAHTRALDEQDVSTLVGNLNFDMVGSPNPGNFIFDGDGSDLEPSIDLHPGSAVIESLFQEHFDAAEAPHAAIAFEGRTDYVGFALAGLPVGGTFTGAEAVRSPSDADLFGGPSGRAYDPCYHRECDTVDNIDQDSHELHTRAAASVLDQLLADPGLAARRHPPLGLADRLASLPLAVPGAGCSTRHEHPDER